MTNPIPEQRESWDDMAGTDYDDVDLMENDDQDFDDIDPTGGFEEDESDFDDCEFEDDGQPTMYEEYQDLYGGDDQFDGHLDSGDGW